VQHPSDTFIASISAHRASQSRVCSLVLGSADVVLGSWEVGLGSSEVVLSS